MTLSALFAPALIAGAFTAVGIALAPTAAADRVDKTDSVASAESPQRGPNKVAPKERPVPNNATSDFNSKQIPQGWRNDALWGGNPAGSNPVGGAKVRPPVIALD